MKTISINIFKNIMSSKKIIITISILAVIIIASVFGFKKQKNNLEKNEPEKNEQKIEASIEASRETPSQDLTLNDQDVFQGNRNEYEKMIGSWDTGCLVADPKNPLAEKHEFAIKENGTARHQRLSGPNCENLVREKATNQYKIEIPEIGKINFIALSKDSDNIFDIYKIEGSILYFGHGPRDWYPLSLRNFGGSLETRFDALNTFLKYKKQ